jgi:hypothetical protein
MLLAEGYGTSLLELQEMLLLLFYIVSAIFFHVGCPLVGHLLCIRLYMLSTASIALWPGLLAICYSLLLFKGACSLWFIYFPCIYLYILTRWFSSLVSF